MPVGEHYAAEFYAQVRESLKGDAVSLVEYRRAKRGYFFEVAVAWGALPVFVSDTMLSTCTVAEVRSALIMALKNGVTAKRV